jgi:hypothetical protein
MAAAPVIPKSKAAQLSGSSLKFPSDFNCIKTNGNTTIAIAPASREPIWEKVLANTPSIIFSLVALAISIKSFSYNKHKDKRSREQSIHDDFWIRKIISPISVEPFLKYATELSASLPLATNTTGEQVKLYWADQATKVTQFSLSFRTFGLVDMQLDSDLEETLEKFDDCLADYCGKLRQHLAGALETPPDRGECARTLIEITLTILKLIRAHQASVGDAG